MGRKKNNTHSIPFSVGEMACVRMSCHKLGIKTDVLTTYSHGSIKYLQIKAQTKKEGLSNLDKECIRKEFNARFDGRLTFAFDPSVSGITSVCYITKV